MWQPSPQGHFNPTGSVELQRGNVTRPLFRAAQKQRQTYHRAAAAPARTGSPARNSPLLPESLQTCFCQRAMGLVSNHLKSHPISGDWWKHDHIQRVSFVPWSPIFDSIIAQDADPEKIRVFVSICISCKCVTCLQSKENTSSLANVLGIS